LIIWITFLLKPLLKSDAYRNDGYKNYVKKTTFKMSKNFVRLG
jgi:hypothetical protein